MLYSFVILVSILAAPHQVAVAIPCMHPHDGAVATNSDGSRLSWITDECDNKWDDYITYTRNGVTTKILDFPNGVNNISFFDYNKDGYFEIDADIDCGTANCNSVIYAVNSSTSKARVAMHYFGTRPYKIGIFFSVMSRNSAVEHQYAYYKIISYKDLKVAPKSALTLTVDSKEDNNGIRIPDQYVCIFSLPKSNNNELLLKSAAKADCPQGSQRVFKTGGL